MIFLSRYPGEAVVLPPPPALQLLPSPDLISIHPHQLEAGRFLVVEWVRDAIVGWRQIGEPVNVASLENALEYVPPGADDVTGHAPAGWAARVYLVG